MAAKPNPARGSGDGPVGPGRRSRPDGMPGAGGVHAGGSCQALCRSLVSQKGPQGETADISQSVLYTSMMGLLLVADNEVRILRFTFI